MPSSFEKKGIGVSVRRTGGSSGSSSSRQGALTSLIECIKQELLSTAEQSFSISCWTGEKKAPLVVMVTNRHNRLIDSKELFSRAANGLYFIWQKRDTAMSIVRANTARTGKSERVSMMATYAIFLIMI